VKHRRTSDSLTAVINACVVYMGIFSPLVESRFAYIADMVGAARVKACTREHRLWLLVDGYRAKSKREKLLANAIEDTSSVIAQHGCSCDCECGHSDDCDHSISARCLACQVCFALWPESFNLKHPELRGHE
jgi:hypothetical protein